MEILEISISSFNALIASIFLFYAISSMFFFIYLISSIFSNFFSRAFSAETFFLFSNEDLTIETLNGIS